MAQHFKLKLTESYFIDDKNIDSTSSLLNVDVICNMFFVV